MPVFDRDYQRAGAGVVDLHTERAGRGLRDALYAPKPSFLRDTCLRDTSCPLYLYGMKDKTLSILGVLNSTVVKNASVEWEKRKVGDPVDDLGYELRVNVYRDSVCRRLSWFDSRFLISSSTSRESITGYRIRFQLSYLFVSRVYQPVFLQVP
ncbi:hypothetical protein KQX54_006138 [Cotesia glomerata]|uniref:Uncharacterized protein n=1 Tax=Cotesia glomerata TaxID=32391 RepID=A0AAV7I7C8_COTGL|nr:hypothetical protein KQX54_006138 [Cotesia glomerata]